MNLNFQIFRIQIKDELGNQTSLFDGGYRPNGTLDRKKLLTDVFGKFIQQNTRYKNWGVGNFNYLEEEEVYYLKFGRIRERETPKYNEGEFFEETDTEAPSTLLVFDVNLQVIAVAKNTRLAPHIKSIANAFSKYLNSIEEVQGNNVSIEIEPIFDPTDFISIIEGAYQIHKFWVRVKYPNAIDVNQDFILPLEKTLAEVDGQDVKAEFKGDDLKKEPLEEFTRSCASKGNEAGARLTSEEGTQPQTKKIGQNPVTVDEDDESPSFMENLIRKIRSAYNKVRHGEE